MSSGCSGGPVPASNGFSAGDVGQIRTTHKGNITSNCSYMKKPKLYMSQISRTQFKYNGHNS